MNPSSEVTKKASLARGAFCFLLGIYDTMRIVDRWEVEFSSKFFVV